MHTGSVSMIILEGLGGIAMGEARRGSRARKIQLLGGIQKCVTEAQTQLWLYTPWSHKMEFSEQNGGHVHGRQQSEMPLFCISGPPPIMPCSFPNSGLITVFYPHYYYSTPYYGTPYSALSGRRLTEASSVGSGSGSG